MNRTRLSLAALFFIAVIVALCCKKSSTTSTYNTTNLKKLFSGLNSTPQNFTVTAGRDTMIFAANGTMLHFYKYSFKDGSGNILSSGTVSMQVVEMYKPGVMVANGAPTNSNGQILQSGGQVNITATMNSQPVYAYGFGIGFRQPGPSTQKMHLFYGNNSGDTTTNWNMADTINKGTTANGTLVDTFAGLTLWDGYYFLFDSCKNLNFINCDALYDSFQKTNIPVVMPDRSFNPDNTQVYVILPTINSMTIISQHNSYDINTNTFSTGPNAAEKIPIGMKYDLVVIANKNGSYYYYETTGTTTAGMTIHAALAPETQGDIIARLSGL